MRRKRRWPGSRRSSATDRRCIILTRQALPQQQRTPQQSREYPPGRLYPDRLPGHSAMHRDRDGLRGRHFRGRRQSCECRGLAGPPGLHALRRRFSTPRTRRTGRAFCRRPCVSALAVEAGADPRLVEIRRVGRPGAGHRPLRRLRKGPDLFPHFGFTADNVGRLIRELIKS